MLKRSSGLLFSSTMLKGRRGARKVTSCAIEVPRLGLRRPPPNFPPPQTTEPKDAWKPGVGTNRSDFRRSAKPVLSVGGRKKTPLGWFLGGILKKSKRHLSGNV